MKKLSLFVGLVLIALSIQAQDNKLGVTFKEVAFDFGAVIETGGKVTHDFEFTNGGSGAITLKSVKASCGCTTPNWPKTPIAPNESAKIAVTYNPQGRPGVFNKTITIVVGGENNKQETFVLKISGEVVREKYPIKIGGLSLERQHVTFHEIKQGEVKSDTIGVYNNSDEILTIGYASLPKYLTMKIIPKEPMSGQKSNVLYQTQTGSLVITYNSKKSEMWEDHTDSIALIVNGKVYKEAASKLRVFASLKEDFSSLTPEQRQKAPIVELSQSKIKLGEIRNLEGKKVTVVVKNPGLSTLKIRKIDTMCKFLKASIDKTSIEPGKSATITLELVRNFDLPDIDFQKRVKLITNVPDTPYRYITLEWKILK